MSQYTEINIWSLSKQIILLPYTFETINNFTEQYIGHNVSSAEFLVAFTTSRKFIYRLLISNLPSSTLSALRVVAGQNNRIRKYLFAYRTLHILIHPLVLG